MKSSTQERKQLLTRLAGYTATAGAMLALSPNAIGQVAYSGLQNIPIPPLPDVLDIDMNGDAVNDFTFIENLNQTSGTYIGTFFTVHYSSKSGYVCILNGRTDTYNYVLLSTTPYYMPRAFNEDVNINYAQTYWYRAASGPAPWAALAYGASSNWTFLSSGGEPFETQYHSGSIYGNFTGGVKYLGVAFYIGPNIHFGWIRINVIDFLSMNILDWAYEQTPSKGIITGDKPPMVVLNAGVVTTHDKTIVVSVKFNEEVTGLTAGDFSVGNGSANNLMEWVSGKEYTIEVTANNPGEVIVELPGGAVTDLTGNPNPFAEVSFTYEELLDINEINDSGFKLYPNPVTDQLNIVSETEARIIIIDLHGRVVLDMENVLEKTIDVSTLPEGLYTMKVITNKGVMIDKFVKK